MGPNMDYMPLVDYTRIPHGRPNDHFQINLSQLLSISRAAARKESIICTEK